MSRSPLPLLPTLTGPTLPASVVDLMIQRICCRATPRAAGRRGTAGARKARTQGTGNLSPSKRSAVSISPSPVGSPDGFSPHSPIAKRTLFSVSRENSPLLALCDLEFRKAFLILNYTTRRKLEEHMRVDDIMMLKDLPMRDFETKVWDAVGKDFINKEDRIQGAEFQVFSSQNRLGTGPDGLRIYLAFCIQDNDSAEDETNHDNSEMKKAKLCIHCWKSYCLLVCPTFCASLIKRVLNNFVLDGFLSAPNFSCCA